MKKIIFIYTLSIFLNLYSSLCFAFKSPSKEDIQFVKNCKLMSLEKETSIKQQYDTKINDYIEKMSDLMSQMNKLIGMPAFSSCCDESNEYSKIHMEYAQLASD